MIRVSEPVFGQQEYENLVNCIKHRWISNGPMVREFERKMAESCGKKYAVACTNATSGMHLALRALGVGKGWKVVVPTFTMIGTALPVHYVGAEMLFCEAELDTWCMDSNLLPTWGNPEKSPHVIMPVHIYGHPVLPFKTSAFVIEDCAEAQGAVPIGWGDIQVYSFFPNKMITAGEGGMVVTDDSTIADKVRSLRCMAFGEEDNKFIHREIGYNYRMTDLQAAVGLAQLERLQKHVDKKRLIANWYNERLEDTVLRLPIEKEWATSVYWMYGVVLPRGMDKVKIMKEMLGEGVETRHFFYPMHLQPCFGPLGKRGQFPVAEFLSDYGFYLPSGLGLEEKDVDFICSRLRKVL